MALETPKLIQELQQLPIKVNRALGTFRYGAFWKLRMTVNGNKQFNGRFSISSLQKPNFKGYQIYIGMLLSGAARWDLNQFGVGPSRWKIGPSQETIGKQVGQTLDCPVWVWTDLTPPGMSLQSSSLNFMPVRALSNHVGIK